MVIGEKISTKWLKYDVDGELLSFKVRFLSARKMEDLKISVKGNDNKHFEKILDFLIIDWQGIEIKAGKPAPCTLKNKLLLAESLPEICGRSGFLLGAAAQDFTFMPDTETLKKKLALSLPISGNGAEITPKTTVEDVSA